MNKTVMGTFSIKGVDVSMKKSEAEKKASDILGISQDKIFVIKNDYFEPSEYLFKTTSDKDELEKSISVLVEKFKVLTPDEVITILSQFFVGTEEKNIYDATVIKSLINDDDDNVDSNYDNILSLLSEESILNIRNFLSNNR